MAIITGDIKLDLIGLLVSIVAVIYVYFKWSFQYWEKRNVPYLPGNIPYGTIVPPYKGILGDQFAAMYNDAKRKGWRYFGAYLFTRPNLVVTDLDLLKNIMTKDFNHFTGRGVFANPENENISGNLFALGGAQWRNMRVKLTPTFTSGKMRTMFQIIQNYSIILEKQIEKLGTKREAVDIKDLMACFTLDVIGSCAFGLECNTFTDPNNKFLRIGKKVFELDFFTIMKQQFAISFPALSKLLKLNFNPREVQEFYDSVVRDAVAYREKNKIERKDFLQMLIEMKNNQDSGDVLTMDEIIAQCFVFFLGGFETSSTAMTFATYELATHPEIQERVREEIHQVLNKHNNKLTYDSLKELEYMEQVIDETLRKYPPLPFLNRECSEDYIIPNSKDVIEKGTPIIIPVKGIHYDKDIYENPEEFNPDRFSPENKKNRHQYAHIPFGEGPRICIGMRFGLTQTKVGLTTLLKNHKITLSSKTQLPLQLDKKSPIVPLAKGGVWLNLEQI